MHTHVHTRAHTPTHTGGASAAGSFAYCHCRSSSTPGVGEGATFTLVLMRAQSPGVVLLLLFGLQPDHLDSMLDFCDAVGCKLVYGLSGMYGTCCVRYDDDRIAYGTGHCGATDLTTCDWNDRGCNTSGTKQCRPWDPSNTRESTAGRSFAVHASLPLLRALLLPNSPGIFVVLVVGA